MHRAEKEGLRDPQALRPGRPRHQLFVGRRQDGGMAGGAGGGATHRAPLPDHRQAAKGALVQQPSAGLGRAGDAEDASEKDA